MIPPLYKHQTDDINFILSRNVIANFSDPGTGKTRTALEVIRTRAKEGRTLIICPKSIMEPAWANDIEKFTPELTYSLAYASKRLDAFIKPTNIVIMNHDGVTWLAKNLTALAGFTQLFVDECFTGDTLIATPAGPQQIKVVKCGDLVYSSAGIGTVSKIYTGTTHELTRLHLADGTTLTCTPNHPFATEKGWIPARDLRNLSVVQHNLHQLATSATLLQPLLLQESHLGKERPYGTSNNSRKKREEIERSILMEQRITLERRNQRKTTTSSSSHWPSPNATWRQRSILPHRSTNSHGSSPPMETPICNKNQTAPWFRLPTLLQSGFRLARKFLGLGNRRKLTLIAQATGREKRFLSKTIRVDRVENIELQSPISTYNLQVEGSNDYFANGILVHNCTAYKNHSQRTKAIFKICEHFKHRCIMTGTPYTNSITDVWRQAFILDNGERLGKSYFRFREITCKPRQLGNGVIIWEDKDGMEPIIYQLLADITIRHRLEDCIDIPPNATQDIPFTLNETHYNHYKILERDSILELKTGKVTAVNAAILRNKLLQVASGAVYSTTGDYALVDHDRYELIRDLAEARSQTVIAYQWKHQRDTLAKLIPNSAVIGGDTPIEQRHESIYAFQAGHIKHLIIHPKTGAHGLTLTAGHATIWASPPPSPEAFTQFNRRIYRAGQTKKTETLLVTAKNTIEGLVYQKLNGKLLKADLLLELFNLTEEELHG